MNRLKSACNKLLELKSITGKNDKISFIKANKSDKDFLALIESRLNPYKNYGIKTINVVSYSTKPSLTFDNFMTLLNELNTSNVNNTLRKLVDKTMTSADYSIGEILIGIITKTLSLGADTSVNKALGYQLIPTFDCMLASPIKEGVDIPIPCIVDLKYDGVRCIAIVKDGKCKMFTRQGRQLSFPNIEAEIVRLANGKDIVFDGELETESRTGISGICNSNLKTGHVGGSDDLINYYVFDTIPYVIYSNKGKSLQQKDRTLELQKMYTLLVNPRYLRLAESQTINSLDKLKTVSDKYINDGYEGVIVKDPSAVYAYKRNKAWLKIKAINSTTLKIVGTTNGTGKREGKIGALQCESSCGKIKVNVGSGLNDDDIETFTKVSPIGKYVEVLFNVVIKGEDSDTYSLFLPRYKELRIDKDSADSLAEVLDQHIGKPEI